LNKLYSIPYFYWKVDLIYIDANHTFEGCRDDILTALKLKPRWISGHDYADWLLDVVHAVDGIFGRADATFSDGSWIVDLSRRWFFQKLFLENLV
jgi:hypothetical protein